MNATNQQNEITPAEAIRRLREVFPAHLGYNAVVCGQMYSYARDPEVWGAPVSEGWRYEASVWRGDWHLNTNQMREYLDMEPQTLAEAVERLLRVIPFVPPAADERMLFRTEVAA